MAGKGAVPDKIFGWCDDLLSSKATEHLGDNGVLLLLVMCY